jgi:hypothetical protein
MVQIDSTAPPLHVGNLDTPSDAGDPGKELTAPSGGRRPVLPRPESTPTHGRRKTARLRAAPSSICCCPRMGALCGRSRVARCARLPPPSSRATARAPTSRRALTTYRTAGAWQCAYLSGRACVTLQPRCRRHAADETSCACSMQAIAARGPLRPAPCNCPHTQRHKAAAWTTVAEGPGRSTGCPAAPDGLPAGGSHAQRQPGAARLQQRPGAPHARAAARCAPTHAAAQPKQCTVTAQAGFTAGAGLATPLTPCLSAQRRPPLVEDWRAGRCRWGAAHVAGTEVRRQAAVARSSAIAPQLGCGR